MEHNPTSETNNQRKSTRFIRTDIKVSVEKSSFIGLKETINCKLLDISSTGIQMSTPTKFGTATKLTVNLVFDTGKTFNLKSRIVRQHETNNYLSIHSFPKIKKLLDDEEISLNRLCLYDSKEQVTAKFRKLGSSSVKILTHAPLNPKKQHSLIFILSNGKKHKVLTRIRDSQHHIYYNYGIKFDKTSDELADYILETQTDLVFK